MRKGFIISSAVMVFVFAVMVALFMFVLSENELHNTAMTGLAVEKTRWISDADDYFCKKDITDTSDWDVNDYNSFSDKGPTEYLNVFKDAYSRNGNKSHFVPFATSGSLSFDFFEPYGGFQVNYVHDNPPHIALVDPKPGDVIEISATSHPDGLYDFNYDVCDAESPISDLRFWIYYRPNSGGSWTPVVDESGNRIANVPWTNSQSFKVNLSETPGVTGDRWCFKIVVQDPYGLNNTENATSCYVNVSTSGCKSAADCDDGNECTTDTCNTADGTCSHSPELDNTPCSGGICCSGSCTTPTCYSNSECDSGNPDTYCYQSVCNNAGKCNADCSYSPINRCGDGVKNCGEACDPNASPTGCLLGTCTPDCTCIDPCEGATCSWGLPYKCTRCPDGSIEGWCCHSASGVETCSFNACH
ncbi:MAG: hypothetical protein J7L23_00485 [Candidatus Diapherotrites archaeon]|nr:hypothetical protein [Candidatus Diapherotrites archaeon]